MATFRTKLVSWPGLLIVAAVFFVGFAEGLAVAKYNQGRAAAARQVNTERYILETYGIDLKALKPVVTPAHNAAERSS